MARQPFIEENKRTYIKGLFTVVVEQDEDGYLISEVVELPGCRTQAKTYDQLMERMQEAITGFLRCC